MDFVILQSFNNYIDAHLLMGRLESEGIECWLQDENTVTIYPVWTNAVGGIKLMVKKEDAVLARQIFWEIETNRKHEIECPKCKGHNIELVSTPRKASNWISAIFGFMFANYAMPADNVNHCFDCGHEFENVNETSNEA
jgi:Putative prokaryotic signal transducing protein